MDDGRLEEICERIFVDVVAVVRLWAYQSYGRMPVRQPNWNRGGVL